jgi:hypothetical protein
VANRSVTLRGRASIWFVRVHLSQDRLRL